MEIRAVKASEIDETIDLQCMVYRPGEAEAPERYGTYMHGDPTYTLDHTRVVFDQGRLVAHLRIWDRTLRIRGADVEAAGIGSLLVHPDYRKQGYALALMRGTERYFAGAGYDIGLLFTIIGTSFYEAQGWTPINLPIFEARVEGVPSNRCDGIRQLDAERDLAAVEAIYARGGLGYCGCTVRPPGYWLSGPSRIRSVFPKWGVERGGQWVGYVNFAEDSDEVWIREACALPGEEWAYRAMAEQVLAEGRGKKAISGSLPISHGFVRAFESVCGHPLVWDTDDHMMLKMVNWRQFTEKFGGEFSEKMGKEGNFWRALYGVADAEDPKVAAWLAGLPSSGEAFYWDTDGF